MALLVKDDKQRHHIEKMLDGTSVITFENGLHIDGFISFDDMALVVDYIRSLDTKDEEFEKCWVAYGRKGSKKKSKEQWVKLSESQKGEVMPHIRAYVETREPQFRQDFERYLRDRTFTSVVYSKAGVVYDPTKSDDNVNYVPTTDGSITWNDYYKCYIYTGFYTGIIYDGYDDAKRPNGARIMLNNGRGTITWDGNSREWKLNLL